MVPTPNTPHVTRDPRFESVYDPAEDTFILLDALEADIEDLIGSKLVLEIGCGSGCVTSFVSTLLGPTSSLVLATDINPAATSSTAITSTINSTPLIEPILTTLYHSLLPRLLHSIDLLIFNPPYVPTSHYEASSAQEREEGGIASAWAGGRDGMQVTDLVLEKVGELLSQKGRFYLVAVEQNRPLDIIDRMSTKGLQGKIVLKRRAGIEHLSVIRFTRIAT